MRLFHGLFTRKRANRRRRPPRRIRLRFEGLEDRRLLTTMFGNFNGDGYTAMVTTIWPWASRTRTSGASQTPAW
jgi:hypothetical protein